MKLATFTHDGRTRIGLVQGTKVRDLDRPASMIELLAGGDAALGAAATQAERAPALALDTVKLEAPIPRPGKFLAIGLNYGEHIAEVGANPPDQPSCFVKVSTAITGPFDPIERPIVSDSLDYEGELGIVVGRRCKHVAAEQAGAVIAGYVIVNDVSVREWQARLPQVVVPKGFDTCAPFGPWITTADEVGDPRALTLRTWVNGEMRQNGRTADMLFSPFDLIAFLSQAMTLEPGDIIATGTPPGVGHGFDPPRYLRAGDIVRVEIDRLGAIENPVIDERPPDAG